MPLADCLAKIDLDPKEAEALKARAAELVSSGAEQGAAELQAAQEFLDQVNTQVEDIRGQIGAPGPVDIPSADVASAGASQLLDAHIDELFQAVTLRKGTETLKKYGLKPGGTYTTRQVAAAMEARQRAKWGRIDPKDRSPESLAKIAKWMADEVEFEMQNPEKSGAGWYGVKFQRALDIFAQEFSELAFDKDSRDVFTALVAITSNGEKVFTNFTNAADIYKTFKETGRFELSRGSQRESETAVHLQRLQELHDRMGAAEMSKFLMQQKTVKELKQIATEQGLDFSTDYQVDIILPMGAVILGPKLGAFYANLMGADGYLTMDRWWSRTFNRYRGVLLDAPTKPGLERFKGLIGKPEISDDEALAETVAPTEAYSAKGFKNGTDIEKAANTLYKAAFVNLRDIPDNAKDRTFMLDTVAKAKANLKRRGFNTSVADIQAILWYFEKRLYGEMGARDSADVSYEEAAARVVSERLGRPMPAEQDRTPIGEEEMTSMAGGRLSVDDFTVDLGMALKQPGWSVVTATQEAIGAHTAEANIQANAQLEAELNDLGIEYIKTQGVYEGTEQGASFLILSDLATAQDLGTKYRQDSVLTSTGLTYNDGSLVPATGLKIGEDAKKSPFYSVMPDGTAFSFDLDFEARTAPVREFQQSKPKKGELPRTVKAAVEAGKPFKLIHWSSTPGLKSLDPKFAGTAGAGQEAALYKQGLKKRLNFGLMGRYRLESMVPATAAYEVTVKPEEVYDIYEDPLGIRARASEKFPSDPVKRRNWADDQGRKAGFSFFYSSKEGPWFPVLYSLDRVSVKQIDDPVGKGLVRPEMPTPTAQERATYLEQSAVQTAGAESLGNTFDSRQQFFQTGRGEARGSLKIVDDKYIVSLFDGADLSTVLHETGHIFLEEMHNIVANGYAGPQTVQDYNTLMGWLGNEGEAITRDQHETFAVNFEAYLLRGKAPTKSLAGAFGTFRRWLTRIYEKVVTGDAQAGLEQVGGQKVNLTPEVVETFDRLLTLESEAQLNELDLELAIPPGAKGEDDKFKAQRTRIADLMDSARQKLEDRLYARRAAAISEKKDGWKAQAEKDLKDLPIYKAAEYLKSAPLDVATLIDRYGKRVSSLLQAKGLAAADGLGTDPDTVAAEFGFDSGKSLVDMLRDTPSLPYAVRQVVKGKADAEWSSYTAADAMAETPEYQEVLAASGEYFAQSLGRKSSDPKGIRAEAERMLANLPVGEAIKVDRFLLTMAKLQRQERAAAVKGNFDEALARNRQSRVHLEAARIARGMKDDVEAIEARVNKMAQAKAGSVDFNFHVNALVLAVRHQLLPIRVLALPGIEKVPALRALLTAQKDPDSELYEPAMDVLAGFSDEAIDGRWPGNDGKALPWKSLTIDQLTELDHLMRFLETRGRQLVSDKILGGKIKAEDAAAEIMTVASKLTDKKVFEEGSVGQRATKFTDGYLAALNLWLFRVRAMDGFKNISPEGKAGPAEKYLYDPLHEKSNERYTRFENLMKAIDGPMKHFQKRMRDYPKYVDIGVPVTEDMKKNGRVGWTFENILVVALNSGNTYNAEAMARGLGMVTEGEPDVARLQSITKIMTGEDWAQVQNIWDTVNSLWPDLAAVFERRNGFPLAKVDADPFEVITADGKQIQVKGGYYPVKFDTALSDRAAEQSEAEELANAAGAMFPLVGTKKGMTIKRTNTGGKPLSLSLGSLTSHLRDTVQYVSYSETVVDVYRIVRDPAFKQLFVQKFGKDAYQNIRKMLAEIGLPEAGMIDQWDRALDSMRGAATAWMLGLNFGTVIKQIPAIFNYASDEGWINLGMGLKGFAAAPITVTKEIRELSPFMAEREMAADRDVADALKTVNWLDKPRLRKVQQAMFYPIRMMDALLARPMWYGSYIRRVRDGMSPADAANEADKAIAATVPGNTRPLDLSALQRDKRGWMRLLTSFSTSTFHFGSRQRFYMHAVREGAINPAQYGYKVLVEGVAAPLATLAMMDLLWGNWPPEEEKAKKYWLELGAYQFVGMPILREVVNLSLSDQPRKFGESIPTFSGLDMMVGGIRSMAKLAEDLTDPDEKKTQRALWAVADLVSFVTRVPASRVFERSYEGIRQAEAFNDDDKWLNELNDAFTILIPDPDKRGQK